MISLKKIPFYVVALAVCFFAGSLSLSAFADVGGGYFPVTKKDGSVSFYRFKSAHYDVGHELEVEKRLAQSHAVSGIPASYKIPRSMLPPMRDQGQRGTCAYFATLGLLETFYMALSPSNKNIELSVECLTSLRNWMFDDKTYTGSDKPTERPDPNGDDPIQLSTTIHNNGVPLAAKYGSIADCRYNDSDTSALNLQQYNQTFTTAANPSSAYGKDLGFDVNYAPTFDQIRALIARNIPVEVGIVVYNEDFNQEDWTFDPSIDNDYTLAGEHAIQLTGYDSVGRFEFKNSWGVEWAADGYGTIDDHLLAHGWGYDKGLDNTVVVHQ